MIRLLLAHMMLIMFVLFISQWTVVEFYTKTDEKLLSNELINMKREIEIESNIMMEILNNTANNPDIKYESIKDNLNLEKLMIIRNNNKYGDDLDIDKPTNKVVDYIICNNNPSYKIIMPIISKDYNGYIVAVKNIKSSIEIKIMNQEDDINIDDVDGMLVGKLKLSNEMSIIISRNRSTDGRTLARHIFGYIIFYFIMIILIQAFVKPHV